MGVESQSRRRALVADRAQRLSSSDPDAGAEPAGRAQYAHRDDAGRFLPVHRPHRCLGYEAWCPRRPGDVRERCQRPGDRTGRRWTASQLLPSAGSNAGPLLHAAVVQLRVVVHDATARYLVSLDDGHSFQPLGAATEIHASWWKGPRPALFAYTTADTLPGFVDFDWRSE